VSRRSFPFTAGVFVLAAARLFFQRWLDSALFQDLVAGCIVLTVVLTILSIIRVTCSTHPARGEATA